ncbi:MAG TPA: GNAT family N-acetyltransferase [Caulobacteraceae bacterium]|jgi:RimJ/RimL family protein N-acetyltransferase
MTAEPEKPFPEHLRMPPTPQLETPRLILRPQSERDIPAVQAGFEQWNVVRYLHAHVPWPYPADGAATHWRATAAREMAEGRKSHWVLTLKRGDGEAIGAITLWADDGESRDMRGFWLDPKYWGRGLMTEAANRVTQYAFEDLRWPHLWLNNAEVNVGSHRIKEKQGAEIVERVPRAYVSGPGVAVIWKLTRENWLARRTRQPGR